MIFALQTDEGARSGQFPCEDELALGLGFRAGVVSRAGCSWVDRGLPARGRTAADPADGTARACCRAGLRDAFWVINQHEPANSPA